MKKMTFREFEHAMIKFNTDHGHTSQGNKERLSGVIVFKQESFTKPYTETQRSYKTDSDQKAFLSNMIGSSLFADCLDGTDSGVRLDWYMHGKDGWEVEYCYLLE